MKSTSVQQIRRITDKVDGWLGSREGPYLYSLAKVASPMGAVVEIGSWKGKSTIWLAKGCQAVNGEKLYAVDPHRGGSEEEFRKNIGMAGVDSFVTPIVKTSMEAVRGWDRPIGLLWIDGDHSYESVRHDFFSWEPKVVESGIIALHDTYSWEGVRRVVDDEILKTDKFQVLGQFDSILVVRKVRSLTSLNHVKRHWIVYLRRLFNKGRAERRHWRALPRKLLRGFSSPRPGS